MSENEAILLDLIRQHENPEKAILTAIQVILWSLSHSEPSSSCQIESIPMLEKSTIDCF
jgi:hypothetical protein